MTTASEHLTPEQRVEALATLVDDALRLLAKSALSFEEGCRIAARAWWLARPVAPDAANRLNVTLHRLSKTTNSKESRCPRPTRSSTSAASRRPGGTS